MHVSCGLVCPVCSTILPCIQHHMAMDPATHGTVQVFGGAVLAASADGGHCPVHQDEACKEAHLRVRCMSPGGRASWAMLLLYAMRCYAVLCYVQWAPAAEHVATLHGPTLQLSMSRRVPMPGAGSVPATQGGHPRGPGGCDPAQYRAGPRHEPIPPQGHTRGHGSQGGRCICEETGDIAHPGDTCLHTTLPVSTLSPCPICRPRRSSCTSLLLRGQADSATKTCQIGTSVQEVTELVKGSRISWGSAVSRHHVPPLPSACGIHAFCTHWWRLPLWNVWRLAHLTLRRACTT